MFSVRDAGVGIAAAYRGGRGMRRMREQAKALDAALSVESIPGGGTAVIVELAR